MDTILFFQSTVSKSWREKLKGVILFAQERNWFVQVIGRNAAKEEIHKEALALSANCCQIVPAALGEQIGDYAAIAVALL